MYLSGMHETVRRIVVKPYLAALKPGESHTFPIGRSMSSIRQRAYALKIRIHAEHLPSGEILVQRLEDEMVVRKFQ